MQKTTRNKRRDATPKEAGKLKEGPHDTIQPKKGPRITTFTEAPEFLRVPFIHSGYRVGYDFITCITSLFHIHNETVNIWSHLVGSGFLLSCLYFVVTHFTTFGSTAPFMPSLFLLCCIYGLLASSTFHWFNCIDAKCHLYLRTIDFGGIAANILGAAWPISYFTFYCHDTTLKVYFMVLAVVSPLMMAMPFIRYFHRHMLLRTMIYAVNGGIPAFTFVHFSLLDGYGQEFVPILFKPVFFAYLCFGTGMILYLTRIPERFWPGGFDLLGTSHQLWHVLVVIGQYILYKGISNAADYRFQNQTCHI